MASTFISVVNPALRRYGFVLLCGCALPAVAANLSETDFLDEMPVVLSASRLSQPVNEAPAAVTIIDQEMIRASGFRDIPELMRLVPGFTVAYTRDNTWAAGYHGLGDAYSRRFQVLVDGRSIYSPHYGSVNWNDLPLSIEDIERIEVVRGPDAAVYGANAFAAVINIISKTAAQVPGEFVSIQLGEENMHGLTVRHGGGDEVMRYRITASAQQRDRFERDVTFKSAASNANGQYFEATDTYFVNGRMDWQLAPDSDVMAQFGLSQGNWNAGKLTADLGSEVEPNEQDSRALYVQVAYHKVESARREWRLQAYYSQNRFDADKEADLTRFGFGVGAVDVNQYLQQTRSNLDLQVNEQWAPSLRAVWGAEVRQETVRSPQNYNSDRTLRGELARASANIEWRATDWMLLQTGAMVEHHYYTGVDVSPRAAVNFTLVPGHTLRMGISRAYRSPTFFEEEGNQVYLLQSGAIANVVTVPSDGLKPERVLSREIGYVGQWQPTRLELDVRLFKDHIDQFIGQRSALFDPVDDGIAIPSIRNELKSTNIGTVDIQGSEFQLRWRPTQALDIVAHFSRVFMRSEITPGSAASFNRDIPVSSPRNSWQLLASYRFGAGWMASVGAWHYDEMKWLSEGDLTEMFTRVDARLARRWKWQGRDVEAAIVGQNLGDDYAEFRDTNVFSKRVYGSLSLAW